MRALIGPARDILEAVQAALDKGGVTDEGGEQVLRTVSAADGWSVKADQHRPRYKLQRGDETTPHVGLKGGQVMVLVPGGPKLGLGPSEPRWVPLGDIPSG